MSGKGRMSEKRQPAEKREKPEKAVSPAEKPLPGLQAPEEFVANLMRSVEATGQVIAKIVENKDKREGAFTVASDMADSGKLFAPIIQYWMSDPKAYGDAQKKLSDDMVELWGRTYKRFLGEKVEPMIEPSAHDPAFRR